MAANDFDIQYVARLARLNLSPAEEETLGRQLGNILQYIETLKQLDVSHVEPTAHAFEMSNVTRNALIGGGIGMLVGVISWAKQKYSG